MSISTFAQVTTNGGSGLNPSYPSLSAAITALNAAAITSPVTITLTANETAPTGGYAITAQGTAVNTITIDGGLFTVTAPTPQTSGNLNDAIIKLIGADFVTIQNFTLLENAANTTTAAATNNMTEWGIALLYANTTDGAQNNTIQNNTITLNRTYQNTFGIYSNSTHSATTVTTTATATGINGGNSGLKIYGNSISNVNQGIVVVGPTAAADHNQVLEIGGSTAGQGNTITNFGSTGTFSGYANVSGTVYGILVRNTVNFSIIGNTVTSSATGPTAGTMRGIFVPAFSNAPIGTIVNTINSNIVSVKSGVTAGTLQGITVEGTTGNATTTLSISNNDLNGITHTTPTASGAMAFISTVSPVLTLNVSNNTFTNLSVITTGTVNFINQGYTMPATATQTFENNRIVTAFTRTAAGTTNCFTTGSSSPDGTTTTYNLNNFSNITLTGASTFTGINNTDGLVTGASTKVVTNNTFSNITGGINSITGISVTYLSGNCIFTNNTINNINGQGAITGINIGASASIATSIIVGSNTITGLTSSGTGGNLSGISCSNTSTGISINNNTIRGFSSTGATSTVNGITLTNSGASGTTTQRNRICDLQTNSAGGFVSGIVVSGGVVHYVVNNTIGSLQANIANGLNSVNGINITSTSPTSVNVFYNTVYLDAVSTGVDFGSSAVFANTAATVALNNNIFVNFSAPSGAGISVAYRRSSDVNATYASSSDRNDFIADNIFTDGLTTDVTLLDFQTRFSGIDVNSISVNPAFLSLTCGNSQYLHIDPLVVSAIEGGGANIPGYTIDVDGDIRAGNAGYTGAGISPDMGADEFESILPNCSTADGGTIANSNITICSGLTQTISSVGVTTGTGISYQWKVSTTPGGPYINVTTGTGTTTPVHTTAALVTGTYYYVLETTCAFGPIVDLSNELTLNVIQTPTVTVNQSANYYCLPAGNPVNISASGADTYTWIPSSGLSASTGSNVVATPLSSTTYTVLGTAANGCTITTPAIISVQQNVLQPDASANPPSVCVNGTTQLLATAIKADSVKNYIFTSGTGATLADMTSATQVILANNDDDPTVTPANIGFTFSFNGVGYDQYSVSPDGWILLGNATAASQFTNNVTNTTNIPKIYPFWDDLATGLDGHVKVLLSGTAPNRILIFEWFVTIPRNTTGNANSTFQTWLYEADGKIEFRYGLMAAPTSGSISGGLTASATNFQSISYNSNSSNNATANNTNTTAPAQGTIYTYAFPLATNYIWAPTALVSNPNISNPVTTPIANTTTYTVTISSGSCVAIDSVTVSTGLPLSSSASAGNGTACANTSLTLQATPTGGGGPFTYSWSGPNSFTSTAQNPVLNPVQALSAGTYTVTILDNCGATSTASTTLTVLSAPNVTLNASSTAYCLPGGSPIVLDAAGADSYSWSPSLGLNGTTGSSVTATPPSTLNYTVVGTSASNGCTASASVGLTVASQVQILSSAALPASTCIGGNSQLSVVVDTIPVAGYTFNSGSGTTLANMTGATILVPSNVDDNPSTVTNIGFNFTYNGVTYNQFSASPDGWIRLGAAAAISQFTNAVTSPTNNPKIYPYWDDVATGTNGNVRSLVTGTSPNSILVVEWFVTIPRNTTGAANSTFQLWLYEADGRIEFRYGAMSAPTDNYSVGLTESPTNFNCVTSSNNTNSFVVENDNNLTTLNSGTIYTFTVPTVSYSWSPSNVLNNATIANPFVSNLQSTEVFTVSATASVCTATSNVTVTVAAPDLTVNTTDATCTASDGSATVNYNNGLSPFNYIWNNGSTSQLITGIPAGTYEVTVTDANGCTGTITETVNSNSGTLLTTISVTDATCVQADGSISTSTSGGTAPYVFNWSNGETSSSLSNLAAGIYNLDVNDNTGCRESFAVTVNSTSGNLTSTAVTTDAICTNSNGTATVTAVNGSTPYSYIWANGSTDATAVGLAAGSYEVTVIDANSCESTSSVTVNVSFNTVSVSLTSTNAVCTASNGTATVIPAGGTSPYSYIWSSASTDATAIGISAGSYSVTATDADGCFAISAITVVSDPGNLVVSANPVPAVCTAANGSVSLTINGGTSPLTYLWTNGSTDQTLPSVISGSYTVSITDANGCISVVSSTVPNDPGNLGVSVTATDAVCTASNGTIASIISGGSAPFNYVWNNGATLSSLSGLSSGNYSLTVTDNNGCVSNALTNILVNPGNLSNSLTSTDATCTAADGSASILIAGGTLPVTYIWSNSGTDATISGLFAGSYNVTATDNNGCLTSGAVVVNANSGTLQSSVTSTDATCTASNGTATISNNGGTAPYTHLWSNGTTNDVVNLSSGNYSASVTDAAGCLFVVTVTVGNNPGNLSGSVSATDAVCTASNGSATVSLTGGTAPFAYIWSNGETTDFVSNVSSGIYFVTSSDVNGCEYLTSVTVAGSTGNLSASSTVSNVSAFGGNDGSIDLTVSGGTAPFTFNWSNGANTEDLSSLIAGSYTVTITDANGCEFIQNATVSQPPVAVINSSADWNVNLFPNPAELQTTVLVQTSNAKVIRIRLVNNLGQILQNVEYNSVNNLQHVFDLSQLASAMYTVEINVDGVIKTQRLSVVRK